MKFLFQVCCELPKTIFKFEVSRCKSLFGLHYNIEDISGKFASILKKIAGQLVLSLSPNSPSDFLRGFSHSIDLDDLSVTQGQSSSTLDSLRVSR